MDHTFRGLKDVTEHGKNSWKTDMSGVDLIIHILAPLPEEYEISVRFLEDCFIN